MSAVHTDADFRWPWNWLSSSRRRTTSNPNTEEAHVVPPRAAPPVVARAPSLVPVSRRSSVDVSTNNNHIPSEAPPPPFHYVAPAPEEYNNIYNKFINESGLRTGYRPPVMNTHYVPKALHPFERAVLPHPVLRPQDERRLRSPDGDPYALHGQYSPHALIPMGSRDQILGHVDGNGIVHKPEVDCDNEAVIRYQLRNQYAGHFGLMTYVGPDGQLGVTQCAHFKPTTARYYR